MNSYSENIKNSFSVVYKTLENVKKLMDYCDKVSESNGYYSFTSKFLKNSKDTDVDGLIYNKFFKIYQSADDEELDNNWKNGPLYVLEINLEEEPKYYVSKFEYEDIKSWKKGISSVAWWGFYFPTDINDNRIEFTKLDEIYTMGIPKGSYKKSYWGLNRTIFRSGNLLELNSENVSDYIFKEFDRLKNTNVSY